MSSSYSIYCNNRAFLTWIRVPVPVGKFLYVNKSPARKGPGSPGLSLATPVGRTLRCYHKAAPANLPRHRAAGLLKSQPSASQDRRVLEQKMYPALPTHLTNEKSETQPKPQRSFGKGRIKVHISSMSVPSAFYQEAVVFKPKQRSKQKKHLFSNKVLQKMHTSPTLPHPPPFLV